MKSISEIFHGLNGIEIIGNSEISISGITIDSRKVEKQFLYAALIGTKTDGHNFIDTAIRAGATAILCKQLPENTNSNITYIVANDVPLILGKVCNLFYESPDKKMQVVGVTGTNGKTTVATLLFELFREKGFQCGLISTVEYRIGKNVYPSTHTTPDVISVYQLMHKMAEAGCSYCFMEVSSHAADQNRIAGIEFTGAIFTNITHDHLDYHQTFEAYRDAKKSFFDSLPSTAFALTNKDDRNGLFMLQNTKAARYTYSLHGTADFNGRILESDFNGTLIQINQKEMWVSLVGEFNAYNLTAVYGAAFLLTEGDPEIEIKLSALPRVNGRFETIPGPKRITAVVDYAHTPDALQNVLETINKIRTRGEKLITVVGCGGNRDAAKRPEMGKIAARLSDRVILTSDNPRDEDPNTIIEQMESGVEGQYYKKVLRITDRKEAIKTAGMMAQPGDVILVAGKGHETYQEISGVKYPFDDKKIMIETFNLIG
ncbi:MAG: UDP-N-acetylmuramoyl-L-alanyl-D-glutamate--2,6-diaminopimelate ligase [Bacteroidetes bacterium]|nr:UDP-N-acetylmuramoyl-L-alanyl-D-glutamate--2,6-diaminopimelate ligase [Bacteroidota bacterium]